VSKAVEQFKRSLRRPVWQVVLTVGVLVASLAAPFDNSIAAGLCALGLFWTLTTAFMK